MTIRITQVRKTLNELENMIKDIDTKIEGLNVELDAFVTKYRDFKDEVYETLEDLNSRDRLTEQQEERAEQYDTITTDLDSIEDDIDLLAELRDKVENIKETISHLATTI